MEKTIENNRVIAEFMGWKPNSIGNFDYRTIGRYLYNPLTCNDRSHKPDNLCFHESWDWLMPACIKFTAIADYDTITDGKYHNRNPHFVQHLADLAEAVSSMNIDIVYKVLVIGIKWYNQQPK